MKGYYINPPEEACCCCWLGGCSRLLVRQHLQVHSYSGFVAAEQERLAELRERLAELMLVLQV